MLNRCIATFLNKELKETLLLPVPSEYINAKIQDIGRLIYNFILENLLLLIIRNLPEEDLKLITYIFNAILTIAYPQLQ